MDSAEAVKKAYETVLEKYGGVPIEELPTETIQAGSEIVEKVLEKVGATPIKTLHAVTFKDELQDAFPVFDDEIDTSFLLELLYYFPIVKTYIAAGTYDQYLYDLEKTVIDNYEAGNFQVSFFYAHLVFMSFVYYCVERSYQLEPDRMRDVYYPINSYNGRNDKPDLEHYSSIYDFSKIPEKEIFKVFRIMGMEHNEIKEISKYVSDRDYYAHATGKGNISEEDLIRNVQSIRSYMETLTKLFLPSVKKQYVDYLLDLTDYDYSSVVDSALDFIFDNNLSIREIDFLCNLGLRKVQDENGLSKETYLQLRKEHCAFIEFCIENEGINIPDGFSALRDEEYLHYRYEGNAKAYVENELGISEYRCAKQGGEFPLYDCLNCGEHQLVYDANVHRYHCFACDQNYTDEELSFCERCGSIMLRNDTVDICPVCTENMSKE